MITNIARKNIARRLPIFIGSMILACIGLAGCVKLEIATPDKPININMNVKIEHEIHIKVDRQIEDMLKNNSNLF
jgi:hypothetical protein